MTEGLLFASREAWLAARLKNIGGSEIAALFGVQPTGYDSLYTLWQIKTGRVAARDLTDERVRWGLRLEECIAHGAAEQNHWTIEKGGYVLHPRVQGMADSLDYVITGLDPNNERVPQEYRDGLTPPGVLQIKNVDWLVHKRQWEADEPPLHIQLQLQHELACTGWEWGVILAFVGGNKLVSPYRYPRRPRIIAEIERRVTDFWASVRDGVEPPVDGTESTAATLAAMYPTAEPEKRIDLSGDNEFPDLFAELKQSRLDGKAAEAGELAAKNRLMRKIGDAELILYNGAVVATCKEQVRKEHVVKESRSRVLRIKGGE